MPVMRHRHIWTFWPTRRGFALFRLTKRAAIELAEMTQRTRRRGDLRARTDATRAALKFDRQILAIARVQSDYHVYTDDRKMRTFAEAEGFRVTGIGDVPLPLLTRQTALLPDDITAEPDSSE